MRLAVGGASLVINRSSQCVPLCKPAAATLGTIDRAGCDDPDTLPTAQPSLGLGPIFLTLQQSIVYAGCNECVPAECLLRRPERYADDTLVESAQQREAVANLGRQSPPRPQDAVCPLRGHLLSGPIGAGLCQDACATAISSLARTPATGLDPFRDQCGGYRTVLGLDTSYRRRRNPPITVGRAR